MALSGVSTLGVRLLYGVESSAGEKPSSFQYFTRVNNIAGIELSTETIDASALEDLVECSVAGRQSSGGQWTVTVNLTDDTIAEWEAAISAASTAKAANKSTWFEVYSPSLAKAFFVKAELPKVLPMPEMAQNELATIDITLTINAYVGQDAAVLPS